VPHDGVAFKVFENQVKLFFGPTFFSVHRIFRLLSEPVFQHLVMIFGRVQNFNFFAKESTSKQKKSWAATPKKVEDFGWKKMQRKVHLTRRP
jgi:hypothetical protein